MARFLCVGCSPCLHVLILYKSSIIFDVLLGMYIVFADKLYQPVLILLLIAPASLVTLFDNNTRLG